ncbi:MAG: 50S ribosomal protein L14 [Patescibacteria group bacterium]|nr:50S ribosomal protein L14 [Patescibacteria group bacterium]
MVQHRSIVAAADNSGAKNLMIIGIPGRSKQRFASAGDVVTCVVKGANPNGAVKDGEVVKAVLVRLKKEQGRLDGSYIRFDQNAAVVVDNNGNPRGTRIFGPVSREVRERGFMKIVSLAMEVL